MFSALMTTFAGIVGWLIGWLPAGPTIPEAAGDLIRSAVAFIWSLDKLIIIEVEISALTSIIVWEITKWSFNAATWIYKRIRGG